MIRADPFPDFGHSDEKAKGMHDDKGSDHPTSGSGHLGWVVVPAIITLAITLLRLTGELLGWDPRLFGNQAGGGGSLLGITWLIPAIGAYFGGRLARAGEIPPHRGRVLLHALLGIAFLLVPFIVVVANQTEGVRSMGFVYGVVATGICAAIGALIAARGWPTLGRLCFAYALTARLPIIVLTFVLVPIGAGTHFEKPAPFVPEDFTWIGNALFLSFAQAFLWVPFTVSCGVLFGGLAALVVPAVRVRGSAAPVEQARPGMGGDAP